MRQSSRLYDHGENHRYLTDPTLLLLAAQCASGYSVYLSMELTVGTSTLQVHSAFVTASIQTPWVCLFH